VLTGVNPETTSDPGESRTVRTVSNRLSITSVAERWIERLAAASAAATFASTVLWAGTAFAAAPAKLPTLDLTLAPHSAAGTVDRVDLTLRIERPDVAAGATLVQSPLVIVGIPGTRFDGDALRAEDARGPLKLVVQDQPPTPTQTLRQWRVDRPTVGDVVVHARALPRKVDATTRNGPLFDLRAEAAGMHGAGMTFVPVPDSTAKHRVRVRWDLSRMPAGSRGVWSLGEKDGTTVDTPDVLTRTFYFAGPMQRYPASGNPNFAMYWLTPPPFDAAEVARGIESFYGYAARFFGDAGSTYRVFIRHNPYPAGGGTALAGSFMFGWGAGQKQTNMELQGLLAHEITHNWPKLDGAEHGETAWYSEGTAEYYSILLSRRAGATDDDEWLRRVNERLFNYYTNPYRGATNAEAAKAFWSDSRAQRVPYGRGFTYLTKVDAQIRAASGGRRSLDDLVLEVVRRQRAGESVGLKEWVDLVVRELGPGAREDYEGMVAGTTLVPSADALAPCLRLEAVQQRPFERGFQEYNPTVVTKLVAGSNAERAGLREGDRIVEMTDTRELQADETKEMTITIERGGVRQTLRYLPRGAPVDGYRFVRTDVPLASCKY
jgi:hypothetical protein